MTKWAVEEKSELLREGSKELFRFLGYELDKSPLAKAAREAESAPETAVDVIGEMVRLGRYQLRQSGIAELPARAARGADTLVEMVREGVKLADYELKNRS